MGEGSQELDPPQSSVVIDASCAVLNDSTQEFDEDPPQTPVPIDKSHAIAEEKQNFC